VSAYSVAAIDCVVNPVTPEVMRLRPEWSQEFWLRKIGRDASLASGVTEEAMLALMDAAGIERAFLIATKTGRLGLPGSTQCFRLREPLGNDERS